MEPPRSCKVLTEIYPAKIVVPLTRLMKKNVTFQWGPDQQLAFGTLRRILCEESILMIPKVMDDFLVYCDAFISGLGFVLI